MNDNPIFRWTSSISPSMDDDWDVEIFPDGAIKLGARLLPDNSTDYHLYKDELDALYEAVERLLESGPNAAEIKAIIRQQSETHEGVENLARTAIMDDATTKMKLNIGDNTHEINYYGLDSDKESITQNQSLRDVFHLHQLVKKIIARVQ